MKEKEFNLSEKKQTRTDDIIIVWTTPISPALEESFRFQRIAIWGIGVLIILNILGVFFLIK